MTVIAWDGKTLAADRESSNVYLKTGRFTKVSVIRGHLVGCAGKASLLQEWRAWFAAGAAPEEFPSDCRAADEIHCLVVDPQGRAAKYESSPYPIPREEQFTAVGSGLEVATTAMYCGKTAVQAVELANMLSQGCSGGVDYVCLGDHEARRL